MWPGKSFISVSHTYTQPAKLIIRQLWQPVSASEAIYSTKYGLWWGMFNIYWSYNGDIFWKHWCHFIFTLNETNNVLVTERRPSVRNKSIGSRLYFVKCSNVNTLDLYDNIKILCKCKWTKDTKFYFELERWNLILKVDKY